MAVKQIPTSEVEIGMFISHLDRPWVETPFLFQGFEVQSQQDIDELCEHTKHVYVMVPDEEIEVAGLSVQQSVAQGPSEHLHKQVYADTVSVEEEVKQVRSSHEELVALFGEIESAVQSGGTLRLEILEQPVKYMVNSVAKNPDAYLWLTRLKKFDSFLYKDSLTAAVLGTALGRQLGMPEQSLQTLATGCMLMDIGKLALPTELLHKPERLDHDEWELMKTHVDRGLELLEACPKCSPAVMDIVRTHHERLDGGGYPDGLKGSEIPLFGQIAGIVDQYVAVTSPRPFADPISASRAQEMLYKQRGQLFDEILIEYFIRTLSTYPTGTLVELSTGEVAIVKAQKSGLNLKPDVILLLDPNKEPYGTYTLASLDNYTQDDLPVTIVKTLADGEYGVSIEELSL